MCYKINIFFCLKIYIHLFLQEYRDLGQYMVFSYELIKSLILEYNLK